MDKLSKLIQNFLLAFIMASSIVAWYHRFPYEWLHTSFFNIPLFWLILFIAGSFVANDIRLAFQKVLWVQKREDPLPIWQVGIGMLFYFAQVSFVEQFMRSWMSPTLDGMPLYLVISFLNAFLMTVIFQEIFYVKQKKVFPSSQSNESHDK